MSPEDLRAAVLASLQDIAPEADLAGLGDNDDVRDELDLDSMDFLNFVIGIHERTGIDVPERDYSQIGTVGAMLAYLAAHAAD